MEEEFKIPSEWVKREHVLGLMTVVEGTVTRMEQDGTIKAADAHILRLSFKFFRQEL